MNVERNVVPRDIGDSPVCLALALFFWSCTALIVFGPVVLLAVFSLAWAQPPTAAVPWTEVVLLQVGIAAVVLTPLYFAPGIDRLARSARFALLGPVAGGVALAVLFCVDLPGA
ncbi:hypothetical protein [Streptomyces sp. NPDC048737]|uniref:hypothetical protein n=1 Tax=unclassified Streptomyces TaxID=2593676 RepID=UPI0034161ED1